LGPAEPGTLDLAPAAGKASSRAVSRSFRLAGASTTSRPWAAEGDAPTGAVADLLACAAL